MSGIPIAKQAILCSLEEARAALWVIENCKFSGRKHPDVEAFKARVERQHVQSSGMTFNPTLPKAPQVYEAEQAILKRWKEYTARIDGTENPDFAKGMACGLQEALIQLWALCDVGGLRPAKR